MLSTVLNQNNNSSTTPPSKTISVVSLPAGTPATMLEYQNISNVVLALRTLGNFNFEG